MYDMPNEARQTPEEARMRLRLLTRHYVALHEEAMDIRQRLLGWWGLNVRWLKQALEDGHSARDGNLISSRPVLATLLQSDDEAVHDLIRARAGGETGADVTVDLFGAARRAYTRCGPGDEVLEEQSDMELRRLSLLEEQMGTLHGHAARLLPQCDPSGLALSIPGFDDLVASVLVGQAGTDMARFPTKQRFTSWCGIAPGARGRQIEQRSAAQNRGGAVRWAFLRAAGTAVETDPDMRERYEQLCARGKVHAVALNAIANKLARAYWGIMTEMAPYDPQRLGPD